MYSAAVRKRRYAFASILCCRGRPLSCLTAQWSCAKMWKGSPRVRGGGKSASVQVITFGGDLIRKHDARLGESSRQRLLCWLDDDSSSQLCSDSKQSSLHMMPSACM